jgi:hypothetical protein
MPNRTEARLAKAALTNATGRLPPLRLFSTPQMPRRDTLVAYAASARQHTCDKWALRVFDDYGPPIHFSGLLLSLVTVSVRPMNMKIRIGGSEDAPV